MKFSQSIRAPKQRGTTSASRAKRTRGEIKHSAHSTRMVSQLDTVAARRKRAKVSMSTREMADRYNAALLAATACDPANAPTTGPMVAVLWDGADKATPVSDSDTVNGLDLHHKTFTPVYAGQ